MVVNVTKIEESEDSLEKEQPESISLQTVFSAWVKYGVSLFIREAGVQDVACLKLLAEQERLQTDIGRNSEGLKEEWPDFCGWVQQLLHKNQGAVNQLCQSFDIDLAELFLMALLAEIEYNHFVSLAVSEMQAPTEDEQLSVNLAEAVIDNLFFKHKLTSTELTDNVLFEIGIVKFTGKGPLVLKSLSLDLLFWSALFMGKLKWEGVCPLIEQDFDLFPALNIDELPTKASGELTHYLLKGDSENTCQYAIQLAIYWEKQAIKVSLLAWQKQVTLRLACQLTGCIPIIELLDDGQKIELPTSQYQGVVFLLSQADKQIMAKNLLEAQAPELQRDQRYNIWRKLLASKYKLAESFNHVHINGLQIEGIIKQAKHLAGEKSELTVEHLRRAWGLRSSESLITLAQSVTRDVDKKALVLPKNIYTQMDDLMLRCQHRDLLWDGLGITAIGSKNYGVRSLFVGESGTGKTLAASYLATQLGMPLYRVDISAIMNKYVGESEKNLSRLFKYAGRYDVMLLLDEADSLFGRRGDQDDPGARFGNMLTNFLLTQIESYSGIVILTSNSRARIDPAFIRRLDSIIEFPNPEFAERLAIWKSHLGQRSPGDDDCRRLASYCELAGGAIRNAVLFAAARQQQIEAIDLLDGLTAEYRKLGKQLPAELQQWRTTVVDVTREAK